MSPRTAVTADMHRRVLGVIRAHNGRATIDQIRDAEIVPGALVQETLRELISRKAITMHGTGTYALNGGHQAESPQLAGSLAMESTEQSGRTAEEVETVSGGPAEPLPRRRGRPKKGDTAAPLIESIKCRRCHCSFPPIEFAAVDPRRRRFRLCSVCRGTTAPRHRIGSQRLEQIVEQRVDAKEQEFIRIQRTSVLLHYCLELINTGLYGTTIEQVVERMVCDAIARAIVTGLITRNATGGKA